MRVVLGWERKSKGVFLAKDTNFAVNYRLLNQVDLTTNGGLTTLYFYQTVLKVLTTSPLKVIVSPLKPRYKVSLLVG